MRKKIEQKRKRETDNAKKKERIVSQKERNVK